MNNNVQYCIYCGTENKLDITNCKNCNKELNPKSHALKNYFINQIEDKFKGDLEDNIFSIVTNFIKSHLYGFFLTCSVVFTATTIVATSVSDNYIEKVSTASTTTNSYQATSGYAGYGLTSIEVVEKYVEAIKAGDENTINNLQLESFYPEIKQELVDMYNSGLESGEYAFSLPVIKNDLVINGHIYFEHERNHKDSVLDYIKQYKDYADIKQDLENGIYNDYNFVQYVIDIGVVDFGLYIKDYIELIEIDGNYYVNGEDLLPNYQTIANLAQLKYHLDEFDGDTTQVTLLNVYQSSFSEEMLTAENIHNSIFWANYFSNNNSETQYPKR